MECKIYFIFLHQTYNDHFLNFMEVQEEGVLIGYRSP